MVRYTMKHRRLTCLLLSAVMLFGLICGMAPEAAAASSMKTSEDCIEFIKKLEGFSKYPYYDYGQWTVGYGTACPAEDQARYEEKGITEAEAEELMQEHLESYEKTLNGFIDSNSLKLNQHQFDALVSFTYNLGGNWVNNDSQFRTAVLSGATGNDFLAAISRWCTANGEILVSLVERRLAEANLYLNGVYNVTPPSNYRYVIYDANLTDVTASILIQGYDVSLTDSIRATVSKSGYTFQGWYSQACGGRKITKLDSSVTMTTLYAHWKDQNGNLINDYVEDSIATGLVNADKLNIRSGAGTSYDVVGALYQGDRVYITAYKDVDGTRWGKITKGWVSMDYVTLDDGETEWVPEETVPEATEPEATEPEATEPEVTEPEATEPEATEPEATEPEETNPPKEEKEPVVATGKVVNCTTLRIRKGPGTNYAQVGSLSVGTKVEFYETVSVNGTVWGRIDQGWICITNYVKLDEGASDTTAPSEPAKPVEPAGVTGTVTASSLNVRAGAGTGYAKVGSLAKGTKVTILETTAVGGATWGRIDKGWVHMGYIKLDSGNTSGGSTSTGGNSSGSTSNNGGNANSGNTTASGINGTVTGADWLRVRSGPGTNNSQVTSIARGTKVVVLETVTVGGSEWGRIDKGWICLDYVTLDKPVTKTVTASALNIRSGPGTGYEKVGSYSKGTKVEILETTTVGATRWGKTDKGWISMDYVS